MIPVRTSKYATPAVVFAGVFALSGVTATPAAQASPLDGIRAAVNAARSGSPCGPLNYNFDLEGEAQHRVGNRLPGVPPAGQYKGRVYQGHASSDPTSRATEILVNEMRPQITNCSYKDFGVGMARDEGEETSFVSIVLGEPPVAAPLPEAATPKPAERPIKCTGGPTIPARQTCPPKPPPAEMAPTNAVTLNIVREGLRAKVTVGNTSNLQAQCTYNATEVKGLGIPVNRDFTVNPKSTTPLEFAAPLIGQTYTVVVACRANFNGQDVEIGRVQQDFSSF